MSQIWRRVEHLRKGKRAIKWVAAGLIDTRLHGYEVEVKHKEGNYYNYITLRIKSKTTTHAIQLAFDTSSLMRMAAPVLFLEHEIMKHLELLDDRTRNAPEHERIL